MKKDICMICENAPFQLADIITDIDDHYGFFETLYKYK